MKIGLHGRWPHGGSNQIDPTKQKTKNDNMWLLDNFALAIMWWPSDGLVNHAYYPNGHLMAPK
jgi:hypothetical protein